MYNITIIWILDGWGAVAWPSGVFGPLFLFLILGIEYSFFNLCGHSCCKQWWLIVIFLICSSKGGWLYFSKPLWLLVCCVCLLIFITPFARMLDTWIFMYVPLANNYCHILSGLDLESFSREEGEKVELQRILRRGGGWCGAVYWCIMVCLLAN